MLKFSRTVGAIAVVNLIWFSPSWAEETAVTIHSPKQGPVMVSPDVGIELEFIKGQKGDHLHYYVDGKFFKTSRRESVTLWDFRDGENTIEVRAASREKDPSGVEHIELGPKDSIKIRVQYRSADLQQDGNIPR